MTLVPEKSKENIKKKNGSAVGDEGGEGVCGVERCGSAWSPCMPIALHAYKTGLSMT